MFVFSGKLRCSFSSLKSCDTNQLKAGWGLVVSLDWLGPLRSTGPACSRFGPRWTWENVLRFPTSSTTHFLDLWTMLGKGTSGLDLNSPESLLVNWPKVQLRLARNSNVTLVIWPRTQTRSIESEGFLNNKTSSSAFKEIFRFCWLVVLGYLILCHWGVGWTCSSKAL